MADRIRAAFAKANVDYSKFKETDNSCKCVQRACMHTYFPIFVCVCARACLYTWRRTRATRPFLPTRARPNNHHHLRQPFSITTYQI